MPAFASLKRPAASPSTPNTPKARPVRVALAALTGVALLGAPVAMAQDFDNQIAARKGLMRIQAANLGVLAAMVRGQMDYDAETAQAAADNLAATGLIDQRFFWPEGSSLMDVENTRAMPDIWDDYDAFLAEWTAYVEASEVIQAAASDGVEALGPALQGVGRTCGSCHESYQQSQ